jgi:hypothetical protein
VEALAVHQVVEPRVVRMVKVLQDIQVEQAVTLVHNLIQDQAVVAVVPRQSKLMETKLQPLEAAVEVPAQVKVLTVRQVPTQTRQQVIHQAH